MKRIQLLSEVAFLLLAWGGAQFAHAHPMPNSVVLLNVHQKSISGEVQIPLVELQAAIGLDVNDNPAQLIARLGPTLQTYLRQHIRPVSFSGKAWEVAIGNIRIDTTTDAMVGLYRELVAKFEITPPLNEDLRNFYFNCDVVVHQVITHKILVSVRQDWARGQLAHEKATDVGIIALDIPSGKVLPFQVSLQQGSTWNGFKKMFSLGQHHIAEGTDHLMFLLVLLLPAVLVVEGKKWGKFGGVKYSLVRLFKIITAFTVGHSVTLLLAATRVVNLPAQPIEILIALSILVSAIHAYRPLFSGREVWIAAGFGLIHGLAFAETLVDLELETKPLLLSVLGFNLGIEAMQLLIVTVTIPWLILLSQTRFYVAFRVVGAVLVSVAAVAWVVERSTGESNVVTNFIAHFAAP